MTHTVLFRVRRIASCNFVRYGTAGRQENQNAICVLSLNMINDKVGKSLLLIYLALQLHMSFFFSSKGVSRAVVVVLIPGVVHGPQTVVQAGAAGLPQVQISHTQQEVGLLNPVFFPEWGNCLEYKRGTARMKCTSIIQPPSHPPTRIRGHLLIRRT